MTKHRKKKEDSTPSGAAGTGTGSNAGWTLDHNLVGNPVQQAWLTKAAGSSRAMATTLPLTVDAFLSANPRERRPALWRSRVGTAASFGGGDASVTVVVDHVAKDLSDKAHAAAAWMVPPTANVFPSNANFRRAQERLNELLYQTVLDEVLPDLILMAAVEECQARFLATRQQPATAAATTAAATGPSWQQQASPPAYYRQRPVLSPISSQVESGEEMSTGRLSPGVPFTMAALVNRIKQGCALAWQWHCSHQQPAAAPAAQQVGGPRASRRLAAAAAAAATNEPWQELGLWRVVTGGRVALYLYERYLKEEKDDEEPATDDQGNASVPPETKSAGRRNDEELETDDAKVHVPSAARTCSPEGSTGRTTVEIDVANGTRAEQQSVAVAESRSNAEAGCDPDMKEAQETQRSTVVAEGSSGKKEEVETMVEEEETEVEIAEDHVSVYPDTGGDDTAPSSIQPKTEEAGQTDETGGPIGTAKHPEAAGGQGAGTVEGNIDSEQGKGDAEQQAAATEDSLESPANAGDVEKEESTPEDRMSLSYSEDPEESNLDEEDPRDDEAFTPPPPDEDEEDEEDEKGAYFPENPADLNEECKDKRRGKRKSKKMGSKKRRHEVVVEEMEDTVTEEVNDEKEEKSEGRNFYLEPTGPTILEWLGRKTAKALSTADLQHTLATCALVYQAPRKKKKKKQSEVQCDPALVGRDASTFLSDIDRIMWSRLISSPTSETAADSSLMELGPDARLALQLVEDDVEDADVTELGDWETAWFGRCRFTALILSEESFNEDQLRKREEAMLREVEERKRREQIFAFEAWRHKGIQTGCAIGYPSWIGAVATWRKTQQLQSSVAQTARGKETEGTDNALLQQQEASTSARPAAEDGDLALARALASQEASSSEFQKATRRTTRRGADGPVFYGSQSGMTQKQLIDTLLRLTTSSPTSFQTALGLLAAVAEESSDPMRRIRTALGRIVWKRNQLARLPVHTEWTDLPIWDSLQRGPLWIVKHPAVGQEEIGGGVALHLTTGEVSTSGSSPVDERALVEYLRSLHQTEIQLRALVMKHLTELPVSVIATAADERLGSMESMDDVDFEDLSSIEWISSGHALLNKRIFRPAAMRNADEMTECQWYKIVAYVQSIATSGEEDITEKPNVGSAKEPIYVERRMRFRALPLSDSESGELIVDPIDLSSGLVLTEAQVHAGLKAAELESDYSSASASPENPFASGEVSQVSLFRTDGDHETEPITGVVVGHDSIVDDENNILHRILVLPNDASSKKASFWLTLDLSDSSDGLSCRIQGESPSYTIQQYDYHPTSPAFRECMAIVNFLQRHPKALPFLEPVDPVALGVPQYFNIVKHPMDVSTLLKKLQSGKYANIPPSQAKGRNPVTRMLNGPFRRDVELIFDNAMLFNPPDDWIHQAAATLKKATLKKIEQVSSAADQKESIRGRNRSSIYVDYDSDVDMYQYESDQDDEYNGSKFRKRKRAGLTQTKKDDSSLRAIERGIRLQKTLSESLGLHFPFANLPLNSDGMTYALPPEWSCRRKLPITEDSFAQHSASEENELEQLIELHRQVEEKEVATIRRSTRAHDYVDGFQGSKMAGTSDLEYFSEGSCDGDHLPGNRLQVELAREHLHEKYFARMYKEKQKLLASASDSHGTSLFSDGSFPPYLGRVVPVQFPGKTNGMSWEIREPFVVAALRWVIRGLIRSEHLGELEPVVSGDAGIVIANNVYYAEENEVPFEVLDVKELTRRKRATDAAEESSEDDFEMSEYEKARAERVARNEERLKALGLA